MESGCRTDVYHFICCIRLFNSVIVTLLICFFTAFRATVLSVRLVWRFGIVPFRKFAARRNSPRINRGLLTQPSRVLECSHLDHVVCSLSRKPQTRLPKHIGNMLVQMVEDRARLLFNSLVGTVPARTAEILRSCDCDVGPAKKRPRLQMPTYMPLGLHDRFARMRMVALLLPFNYSA